jgi:membrane fusion protein (multidrug efflux system)
MHKFIKTLFITCSVVFFSCKQKQPPPNPPVPVNLYTVKAQHVFYYDKYPSTTEALSQVSLLPEVQGYITGIFFIEGSYVKKGQLLYEIDKRLYQAALDAAAANVKVAQGNQEQAQQDADRYVYLNSHNAVAKQLYDHAVIALQNAKNQVKSAEEAVKTAKTNLAYSAIYAPFNGTIGFSQVKLGNMVSVGQTVLNTISTNNPMAVDFLINEKQLMNFEKIEKQKLEPKDSLFTILLPNNTLYDHTGKISVIDRAVDPQTGSIRVRLVFSNPQNDLKVGMSCIVRVHNQDTAPQLVIPGKAVVEQMGEYFVFVVKDTIISQTGDSVKKLEADTATQKGPKFYAFQKKIQPGQTIGANVIVKSGIDEGDRIVVDGVQLLHEGSQVNVGKKQPSGRNGSDSSQNNMQGSTGKRDSSENN